MSGYAPLHGGGDAESGVSLEFSEQFAAAEVRRGFTRKVFGLLLIQVLITAATSAAFIAISDDLIYFVSENQWTFVLAVSVIFVTSVMIGCCVGPLRTFPFNYILLFALTLAGSFLVGLVCAASDIDDVLIAFGLTAVMTLGLTAFACQTKYDFTVMGGVLGTLLTLGGAVVFLMFFPYEVIVTIAISCTGALVSYVYIVYFVQMLMGGYRHEYCPDDYTAVTIASYLAFIIINVFMLLLELTWAIEDVWC